MTGKILEIGKLFHPRSLAQYSFQIASYGRASADLYASPYHYFKDEIMHQNYLDLFIARCDEEKGAIQICNWSKVKCEWSALGGIGGQRKGLGSRKPRK